MYFERDLQLYAFLVSIKLLVIFCILRFYMKQQWSYSLTQSSTPLVRQNGSHLSTFPIFCCFLSFTPRKCHFPHATDFKSFREKWDTRAKKKLWLSVIDFTIKLTFAGHGGLILDLIIVSILNRAWLSVFSMIYINIKVFTAFQLVRGSAGR